MAGFLIIVEALKRSHTTLPDVRDSAGSIGYHLATSTVPIDSHVFKIIKPETVDGALPPVARFRACCDAIVKQGSPKILTEVIARWHFPIAKSCVHSNSTTTH